MELHEDTALLIQRMCNYAERDDFELKKSEATEKILQTYDLFNLPRPKKVVWCVDVFDDVFARSARSARSAGSARSARSAGSAGSAWSAWSAGSAWSAWSAWSARSAGSAGSAGWTALDDEFYYFVFEYDYCKNPGKGLLPNKNDQLYLDYSELLLQALELGAGYRVEWENTLYIVPTPLVKIDEQNRFHSDNQPAIRWKGGQEFYYLKGENFDKPLWDKIVSGNITGKELMKIGNADKRVVAQSMLPPGEMHKLLGGKLIHTGQRGTKLYKCTNFMGTRQTHYYMWMQDSSTDREFIEFTPPKIGKQGNADLCQAEAFSIPLEDYLSLSAEG